MHRECGKTIMKFFNDIDFKSYADILPRSIKTAFEGPLAREWKACKLERRIGASLRFIHVAG